MSLSNPVGSARENADAYVAALLALLGDRDPLTVQQELPDALEDALDGIDDETLRTPEAPGKWSLIEVIQHLADTEAVYVFRYRTILGDAEPELAGFDQDGWATALHYRDADLRAALDQIRILRSNNLRLLRSLTDEERARVGRHAERGAESVWRTAKLGAAHDLAHRAQIERIKKKLGVS